MSDHPGCYNGDPLGLCLLSMNTRVMSDHPGCYGTPTRLVFVVSEHEGSRRMKTELLVQMDGLSKSDDLVFLLAASNLPWCVRLEPHHGRTHESASLSRADPGICLSITGGPRNLPPCHGRTQESACLSRADPGICLPVTGGPRNLPLCHGRTQEFACLRGSQTFSSPPPFPSPLSPAFLSTSPFP